MSDFSLFWPYEDERHRPAPHSWAVSLVHKIGGPSCGLHCRVGRIVIRPSWQPSWSANLAQLKQNRTVAAVAILSSIAFQAA